MNLALFGASGRTGRPLVEQALEAGHSITALVRTPTTFPYHHERLNIVQGNVLDAARVSEVVAGADVVLSVIGHTKGSPDTLQTDATRHIIMAMQRHGVRRLISLTGAGVRDASDQPKVIDRVIRGALWLLQRKALRDAEAHAELIRRSDLDWVIVRGPRLNEGAHTGIYQVGKIGASSGTLISRADVADFMLTLIDSDQYLRQAPVVSYA